MKIVILSYDLSSGNFSNEQLVAFVGENKNVAEWLNPYPGLILLKTESKVNDLKASFTKFLLYDYFVFAEIDLFKTGGQLTIEMWDWLAQGILPREQIERINAIRKKMHVEEQRKLAGNN